MLAEFIMDDVVGSVSYLDITGGQGGEIVVVDDGLARVRLIVFAELLDDLTEALLVFREEGFQRLVCTALHLGGHQPVDECAIVEADGDGSGAFHVTVQEAVVFLCLIVVESAVIRCPVSVHLLFEALVEHSFHLIDTLAED